MEPLARLLVSLLELAETELALLKRGVVKLGLSLVMLVAAGVFGVIGLCALLIGVFLWLKQLTDWPTAFAISGVVLLANAAILIVVAFGSKKAGPAVAGEPIQPIDPAVKAEGKGDDPASLRIAS